MDDLGRYRNSIYFYNKQIISDIQRKGLEISNGHYWSDGPSSQFKNLYMLANLCLLENDFGVPSDLNFVATSHGKGENDGLGEDIIMVCGEICYIGKTLSQVLMIVPK